MVGDLAVRLLALCMAGQAIIGGARLAGPPQERSVALTWTTIVEMARKQGPEVALAEAERQEAAAGMTGADIYSQTNPDISGLVGPHYPAGQQKYMAYYLRLTWPLPVAGDYASRKRVASRRLDTAELTVRNALRTSATEALSRVLDAQAARDLRAVASQRLAWDEEVLRLAQEHHDRLDGVHHSGDLALAHLLRAQQQAVLRRSEAEEEATLARLRRSLGLTQDISLELPESLSRLREPPKRDALLEHLPRRPDLRQNLSSLELARANEQLQKRMGVPVPSLLLQSGQTPDVFGSVGADLPLPLFQRNQQGRAVAQATVSRRGVEAQQALAQAESDLYSVYARWEGEAAALDSLVENEKLMGEAERLSQSAYGQGQATLDQVVVARREGNQAHVALVEARRAVGRARLELAWVAGEPLPLGEPETDKAGAR